MLHPPPDFRQSLHSHANFWLWKLRSRLKFQRNGYKEKTLAAPAPEVQRLLDKYLVRHQSSLSTYALHKNAQTLSWLEIILDEITLESIKDVVDAGCQDFIRLPSLRAFLRSKSSDPTITGIEIDAYPILNDFHSRWDRAHYYISLEKDQARYIAADFFDWSGNADLVFSFFPFVSNYPALKWGLPVRFASATQWIDSFQRVLRLGGFAVVVHHLAEEQIVFDEARKNLKSSLHLLKRKSFENSLLGNAQAFVSLYQLK
ncbi:MAG: hypothetical protein K2Q26_10740 [Bdellovibrionales bacterium]|nr:hypothetical protein [Bdellovibrionales bacterium]